MKKHISTFVWPLFFVLALVSDLYFAWTLVRLPSDGGAGFLGVSLRRWVILAPMLAAGLAMGAAAVVAWRAAVRSPSAWARSSNVWARWQAFTTRGGFLAGSLLASALLVIFPQAGLALLDTLYHTSAEYSYRAIGERLAPPLKWLGCLGLLLAAAVLISQRTELRRRLADEAHALRAWAWICLGLAALAGGVAWSGIGLQGDPVGSWGLPGVALLEWQIGVALASTFGLALLGAAWKPGGSKVAQFLRKHMDAVAFLGLWALAAALWVGTPLVPGFFATPGRAPNFEIYPFSDGQTYDQYAQSLLVGEGFLGGVIPQRALYTVFLAGLHLLAGQDYLHVIALQQVILALLPAVIYWIGKELHSRPAGVLAALLITLRELTAIHAAPFTSNISYSKLYFSELPTALCLSAFTLFALRWARTLAAPGGARRRWDANALAAGGFIGMAMLIRTQSLAALPLALLAALLTGLRRQGRTALSPWLRGALLAALGVAICTAPWLARNASIAGGFAFDNAASQTMVLAQRYNGINFDVPIPRLPGESESQYNARLMQMALQGMARDPAGTARVILGHFLNNEICTLLQLPVRFTLQQPAELGWPTSAFWESWSGRLTLGQALLVLANLALIAAGLAGATARLGAVGWIPLLAHLLYNFSTAVFRSSGDRFLLPVDWALFLLYAAGWAQALLWTWKLLGRGIPDLWQSAVLPCAEPSPRRGALTLALTALVFLLVGSSLPLAERVFPARYPRNPGGPAQIAAAAQSLGSADLARLGAQPGVILLRGRALYPRYYAAGESEPRTAKTGYAGMDFPRLVFYLVGPQAGLVVLPLPLDRLPKSFPNTADVVILGCPMGTYTRALGVQVKDLVVLSGESACPPPTAEPSGQ
jgi:hypothetical protein